MGQKWKKCTVWQWALNRHLTQIFGSFVSLDIFNTSAVPAVPSSPQAWTSEHVCLTFYPPTALTTWLHLDHFNASHLRTSPQTWPMRFNYHELDFWLPIEFWLWTRMQCRIDIRTWDWSRLDICSGNGLDGLALAPEHNGCVELLLDRRTCFVRSYKHLVAMYIQSIHCLLDSTTIRWCLTIKYTCV